jgi:hypothetical protein
MAEKINVKEILEEISRLEKMQAQVELRISQHAEEEKALKDQLAKMGLKEEDLEPKMAALSASIMERLTFIKNATAAEKAQ